MAAGEVLIVTESDDVHAAAVSAALQRRHQITPRRIDLREFPAQTGSFRLTSEGARRSLAGPSNLDDVRAVWWRRPHPCAVPPSLSPTDDDYRQAECDSFIQGLLWSIPAVWINDPRAERLAVRKLVQLRAAADAGLAVPETLVTNDPAEASAFIASRPGRVVYKRTGTRRAEFSETRLIEERDIARLASIRTSPTTFQDYVDAVADIRVAWIDGEEHAVRIDSQSGSGRVDSRLDIGVAFTPYAMPPSVSTALAELMNGLGLAFGVCDLRVGVDGEIYFLEVNPQGQFAFMEIKTGLPIVDSLADLLATGGLDRSAERPAHVPA